MKNSLCPNCGSPGGGQFCAVCGQRQSDEPIPTLRTWLVEVLDELLLVEARLPRSLRALLWPPGRLTVEWWQARRASYMHPLRLYLIAAVPFFFLVANRRPTDEGFLEYIVWAGYPTALDEVSRGFNEPMGPLSAELAGDSIARSEWQREFQQRRTENQTLRAREDRQLRAGVSHILDFLPVVVGLGMVPFLALLLRVDAAGPKRFVAQLIFSMHLHTVGYAMAAIGWLFGSPLLVGMAGATLYLLVALARTMSQPLSRALMRALMIPVAYVGGFMFMYVGFVQTLTWLASDWLFSG